MGDVISSVTGHFSDSRDLENMQEFFKDRDAGAGNPVLLQTIETVQVGVPTFFAGLNFSFAQVNVQFRKKHAESITAWLKANFKD